MRYSYITHPLLVLFVAFAFMCFTSGCTITRPVTIYDKDGNPQTVEREDPWMIIGWGVVLMLILGSIAAAASVDSSALPSESDIVPCSANTGYDSNLQFVEVKDEAGNTISRHVLNTSKASLLTSDSIDLSEIELSKKIDRNRLGKFFSKNFHGRGLPDKIQADLAFYEGNVDLIQIESLNPGNADTYRPGRSIKVNSEYGNYSVSSFIKGYREDGSKEIGVNILKLD